LDIHQRLKSCFIYPALFIFYEVFGLISLRKWFAEKGRVSL